MFEITAEDIALLDDEMLRAVVARLCEAELRCRNLSPAYVTWGGDQDAGDGGIDVRVDLPPGTAIDGFIPRAATGFQVKQEDMPPRKVDNEMRPKPEKILRPSIQALAEQGGAYVIVSSQGSTADTALRIRRDAMRAAAKIGQNADALGLDFYDRTRIASWLRTHEGLIPWTRALVGRNILGWQSYASWANPSESLASEYLVDDKLRISGSRSEAENGVSAEEGIRQLRNQLRISRSVVRLVGLSGVGKTRLVQALFDERIGTDCLDPATAIYANMADSPDPQPTALASSLVGRRTRAILIIDNCPSEIHQRLSEVCRQPHSNLSVLTVEYDIREDEPEATEVFKLETSSSELIGKLVELRFPALSQVDAHTIADFSGGNARIALALAGRIEQNESIAGLTDEQLFQRLFLQRQTPDQSLYLSAQACSVVYSFEGDDVSDQPEAELARLSALIGTTPGALYRHVAELRARDLVQRRGVWRAVLPHALANRLAAVALRSIPYAVLEQQILRGSSERLLRSFARRLGFLHTSQEAIKIVTGWLGTGGLLENIANFNALGRSMFKSIAPVAPEATLAGLERICAQQPSACVQYVDLLRTLAYDRLFFERCIEVLVQIIEENGEDPHTHPRDVFASLFHLYLSGTQASIEQRLNLVASLIDSTEANRRSLGVLGLRAVLEAWHFRSIGQFDFGARPRDYGYWPRSSSEVCLWFSAVLNLTESFACLSTPVARLIRDALAEKFRGIWSRGGVQDQLVAIFKRINGIRFWPGGWLAVRQTLDIDGKGMSHESLTKLFALEQALRPADLSQKVRAMVLSSGQNGIDFEMAEDHSSDDVSTSWDRTEAIAKDLGTAVAKNHTVLNELLPDLVSCEGRVWSFGVGLHAGAADPRQMWDSLVAAFSATAENLRKPLILRAFLHAVHATDPALADTLLDESLEHETLAPWFPFLQTIVTIDEMGLVRLKRSLALGKAPVHIFRYLSFLPGTELIPVIDLNQILGTIIGVPGGYSVALEIFSTRLHSEKEKQHSICPELAVVGQKLLQQYRFTNNGNEDYRIGEIAKYCLVGDQAAHIAQEVCSKLKAAVNGYETSAFYNDDFLMGLFLAQPLATLDALCGGSDEELDSGIEILNDVRDRKNPLSAVPGDALLAWCNDYAQGRFIAMAEVITICTAEKEGTPSWTEIALQFLKCAPEPTAVLSQFTKRFRPSSFWSGSLADILESKVRLLDQLDGFDSLQLRIIEEKDRVRRWISDERASEKARNRQQGERFE